MNDDDLFKMVQSAPKADMNLRWYLDNYPSLAVKYPDKFLAIDDCTVMDSDSDLNKLLERTAINRTPSMMIQSPSGWMKRVSRNI